MSHVVKDLTDRGLIKPPPFLADNVHYLTMMGSVAYGVSSDTSDCDVYGFCIPPKDEIFPHLRGEIEGFGRQKKRFNQWQQHHVKDDNALGGKGREYDFSVYNIVRYFSLCMDNNPNMLDSLFTPVDCVLHSTMLAEMLRDRRKIFLHKGCYHKLKGYAYSQLHKMDIKQHKGLDAVIDFEKAHKIPKDMTWARVKKAHEKFDVGHRDEAFKTLSRTQIEEYYELFRYMMENGKRGEGVKRFGFDVKFAYHVVRLVNQCEQILTEHDLDLRRSREQLKAVRRGDMPQEEIREYFATKEKTLEKLYESSTLPYGPDEDKIRELLLNCLEHHYGSLENCVVTEDAAVRALRQIAEVVDENRKLFQG